VLGADHDFTAGGTCYYYSNGVDSFVVSWIAVPEFSPDGSLDDSTHTFQLILSAADSSLTFQYGESHGDFEEGGNLADVIGMENVNGQVGLEYLETNLPSNHMWHDGLAVRFHAIPDPSFVVHDFGVIDGFWEGSGAMFLPINTAFTPRGLFQNFGNQPENNLPVRCQIRRGTTSVFISNDTIPHLEPSEQTWLDFPAQFTPDSVIPYRVTFSTLMAGDQNNANNSKTLELNCYRLPAELSYSAETPTGQSRSWNGDYSGFGAEYQIPQDIRITRVSFYAEVTAAGDAYVWVLPDSSGRPQEFNPLVNDTVRVTATGWKDVDISWANVEIPANDKFYIVVLHALQNTFSIGMDASVPLSYRGWEYTGGMAPDRDRLMSPSSSLPIPPRSLGCMMIMPCPRVSASPRIIPILSTPKP
jgi:hypothetical protein